MTPEEYTAVRVGMNVSGAIIAGDIDAGIGLENVQCVELEAYCEVSFDFGFFIRFSIPRVTYTTLPIAATYAREPTLTFSLLPFPS